MVLCPRNSCLKPCSNPDCSNFVGVRRQENSGDLIYLYRDSSGSRVLGIQRVFPDRRTYALHVLLSSDGVKRLSVGLELLRQQIKIKLMSEGFIPYDGRKIYKVDPDTGEFVKFMPESYRA